MGKKKKKRRDKLKEEMPSMPVAASGQNRDIKFNLGTLLFFLIIAFFIYRNSLHNPFIWDDQYLIIENHFIKSFKYIFEIFKHHLYYSSAGVSNFYRPLQTFSLMIDYTLFKGNPLGYHSINILFHVSCAFVTYLLIALVSKRRVVGFLVGLIFLVHPANSTVVDYISSRADSMATLFVLLSVFLFTLYVLKERPKVYLIGSLVAFVLALLSKELAIILPFLLLITTLFVVPGKKELLRKTIPFFVVLAGYAVLRSTVLNFHPAGGGNSVSLYIRLLTTSESFVRLIGVILAPLEIHIEKSIPFTAGLSQVSTIISLIVLSAIGIFMYRVKRYSGLCFFGLVWFFVALIPMANIVPINATFADHWLYLPCIGLFLSIIGGFAELSEKIKLNRRDALIKTALFLYVIAVITLSFMTVKQNNIWKDPLNFYRLALKYSPDSYRAHNEIGIIYLDQGKYPMAISEFAEAISANPLFDQAYDNLGVAYDKNGSPLNAIPHYKRALEINPHNPKIYNNLGNAYNRLNRFDEAMEAYERALRLVPDYKAVYNNMGVISYRKGEYDKAKEHWEKALSIDPRDIDIQKNLRVLQEMRK